MSVAVVSCIRIINILLFVSLIIVLIIFYSSIALKNETANFLASDGCRYFTLFKTNAVTASPQIKVDCFIRCAQWISCKIQF